MNPNASRDARKFFFFMGVLILGSCAGGWVYYAMTDMRHGSGFGAPAMPWPLWLALIAFMFWLADNRWLRSGFAIFFLMTILKLIAANTSSPSTWRFTWWTAELLIPFIGALILFGSTPQWTQRRAVMAVGAVAAMAAFRYFTMGYFDAAFGRTSVMTGQ